MEPFNKFNEEDERRIFATKPDLIRFQQKILSKPNGAAVFDQFIKTSVLVKNGENFLRNLNPQDSSYESIKRMVEEKRRLLEESRQMISEDSTVLEKIANSLDKITTDPFEKSLNIIKDFLGNRDDSSHEESAEFHQDRSLKHIFGK